MASISARVPTPQEREKWKHFFDTVIDPNLATIEIPDAFFQKMKHEFVKHSFGWIRGPKFKKTLVRYLQSNSGMKLSSGICVSRYFGFVRRTRVTLSYVIQENTFWMRILPRLQPVKNEFPPDVIVIDSDDDEDVDQNTNPTAGTVKKNNNPTPNKTKISQKDTLKRKRQKVIIVDDDDQDEPNLKSCRIAKVRKQGVHLKSTRACEKPKNTNSRPKVLIKVRQPNSKFRASNKQYGLKSTSKKSKKQKKSNYSSKPIIPLLKADGSYVWEKIISEAAVSSSKAQVMHFPKALCRWTVGKLKSKILVQTKEGDSFHCKIITARRNEFERFISKEWSKFVKRKKFQAGDKLMFNLQNPPTKLLIQIVRCSSHN